MGRRVLALGLLVRGVVMVAFAGCGTADNASSGASVGAPSVAAPGIGVAAGMAGSGSTGLPTSAQGNGLGVGGAPAITGSPSGTQPTTGMQPYQATGLPMPCNTATAVATNCQKCHGATPIGGAPMSLMTYDDFHQPAKTMPSLKVYELAKMRINNQTKPMPPGGGLPPADFSTLDSWLAAGATAGTTADKTCAAAMPPATGDDLTAQNSDYAPLVANPGETCYELRTHGSTTSVDPSKYSVSTGEHYEQFYFNVPWPTDTVSTRYGTRFDNVKVLHHWLLFTTATQNPDGYHETVIGTQIGDTASLLAGWAVGGTNLVLPDDAGFELPPSGTMLNLQWHFFNSTGGLQDDASAVQICTVPKAMRAHIVTITWLGTEGLSLPAHQKTDASGTCDPLREGMNATDPIHILGFWPHMHQLGINMKSEVVHKGGMTEEIFNRAFDFNHQVHYLQSYDLAAGDTISGNCTFNNTTDNTVGFGPSTTAEMCYQFVFSWPAHSLENHVFSLIGATNTCW